MAKKQAAPAAITGNLSPLQLLALQAAVDEAVKAAGDLKAQCAPDTTTEGVEVEVVVTVGAVSVGHDTDKAPTVSIPLLPALALLVRRMGCTRDAALAMLRECMIEALALDESATAALLDGEGVAEAVRTVREDVVAQLPRTPVKRPIHVEGVTLHAVTGTPGERVDAQLRAAYEAGSAARKAS